MAKQKMVLKVALGDANAKKRSKALKTAVELPGVLSAALDKDRLTVVGDGVDSVKLATLLRRKMGSAELVTVGSAEEKKEEKKSPAVEWSNKSVWQPATPIYWTKHPAAPPPYANYRPYAYQTYDYEADREENCSIM